MHHRLHQRHGAMKYAGRFRQFPPGISRKIFRSAKSLGVFADGNCSHNGRKELALFEIEDDSNLLRWRQQ
jgi:hypothetical protein